MTGPVRFVAAFCTAGIALIVWSLVYALIMHFAHGDTRILAVLAKDDPFVSFKQVYYYYSNPLVLRSALFAAGAVALAAAIVFYMIFRKHAAPLGDARFQTFSEMSRAKLFSKRGIILGAYRTKILRTDDDRHYLVIGPTRSGKGAGFVVPNALSWLGSLLVVDFKREVFELTATHRRAMGNQVYLFSPGATDTHRYNPLDFVRPSRGERITDIQKIAQFLIPNSHVGNESSMWKDAARSLLGACLSYVLESEHYRDRRRIGEAFNLLRTTDDTSEVLARILDREPYLSRYTRDGFATFIAKAEKERSGVKSEVTAALKAWENPLIDAATAQTDFDLRQIRRKRMTIYIAPNLVELEVIRPLLTLLVQQTIDVVTSNLPRADEKESVLFLLDEFTSLNRMTEIVSRMPILAGYNVKLAIIAHGLSHLDELYEESGRNSILSNAAWQIILGANDLQTAEYVSKTIGQTTVHYETRSRSFASLGGIPRTTITGHLRDRPALLPQEVRQFPPKEMLILIEGQRPIHGKKLWYFKRQPFKKWASNSQANPVPLELIEFPTDLPVPAMTATYGANREVSQEPQTVDGGQENRVQPDRTTAEAPPSPAPTEPSDDGAEKASPYIDSQKPAEMISDKEAEAQVLASLSLIRAGVEQEQIAHRHDDTGSWADNEENVMAVLSDLEQTSKRLLSDTSTNTEPSTKAKASSRRKPAASKRATKSREETSA